MVRLMVMMLLALASSRDLHRDERQVIVIAHNMNFLLKFSLNIRELE